MKFLESGKDNLMYLAMAGLVLVGSCCMAWERPKVEIVERELVYGERGDLSLLPKLKEGAEVPVVSAQGVVAIDLDSRVMLYEKNPDLALLPASTTKIMTALVALKSYPLEGKVKNNGIKVDGQKMGLVWGEEIKVEDLLDGLLIFSANDAAEVLAENYPNGRKGFVEAMNNLAQEYHLKNTHFDNPTGLDGEGQKSTARDLVYLAEVAMRDPVFAEIVGTKEKTVKSADGVIAHRLENINELLGEVEGVLGVKTGWTENARENLVTYMERDDRRILTAVLGSQDRFGETKELIDWIFEAYEWKNIYGPVGSASP